MLRTNGKIFETKLVKLKILRLNQSSVKTWKQILKNRNRLRGEPEN